MEREREWGQIRETNKKVSEEERNVKRVSSKKEVWE